MPAGYGGQSQSRWGDNTLNASDFMRDLLITDLGATPRSTADARKKGMLVLAFFRPSDKASQAVLSHLERLAQGYQETGKLTVLAISQEDEEPTRAWAQSAGVTFPVLLDRELYHSMSYGVVNVPTVFFADSSGVILRKIVGFKRDALNDVSVRVAAFADVAPVALIEPAGAAATI